MNIQFACTGCGNQLSVPADAAGKKARCPKCTTVVDVPNQSSDPAGDMYASGGDDYQLRPSEDPPAVGPTSPVYSPSTGASFPGAPEQKPLPHSDNPYASPTTGYDEPKPTYGGGHQIVPTTLEFEAAFSRTWEIFKAQMGICIGAVLLVGAVNFGLSFVSGIMEAALAGEDFGPFVVFGFDILSWLINTFLGIGQSIVLLNVARGRPAEIGEIFAGGPYFLRVLGASILYGLMVVLGFLLLIIPGIVLALMFGQFYMLIIDKDMGVMESFTVSQEITSGNKMTILGVGIVGGLLLLGVAIVSCGLGIIIAGPYIALMTPVVYLMIAGQQLAKV